MEENYCNHLYKIQLYKDGHITDEYYKLPDKNNLLKKIIIQGTNNSEIDLVVFKHFYGLIPCQNVDKYFVLKFDFYIDVQEECILKNLQFFTSNWLELSEELTEMCIDCVSADNYRMFLDTDISIVLIEEYCSDDELVDFIQLYPRLIIDRLEKLSKSTIIWTNYESFKEVNKHIIDEYLASKLTIDEMSVRNMINKGINSSVILKVHPEKYKLLINHISNFNDINNIIGASKRAGNLFDNKDLENITSVFGDVSKDFILSRL